MTSETGKRKLPLSPHPDHLRKEAKAYLADMRTRLPSARLADAQLALARDYGFAGWGHLMAEVGKRGEGPRSRAAAFRRWRFRAVADTDGEEDAHTAVFRIAAAAQVGFVLAAFVGIALVLFPHHARAQTATDQAARRAEQAAPRSAIPFDPLQFDKFTGYYHMPQALRPNTVVSVSRQGDHFFVQLSRQQAVEIQPESLRKFFLKGLPAQVEFVQDAQGAVTGLVFHQGGLEVPMPRIDEATAKSIEAAPLPQPKGHPVERSWQMLPGIAPRNLTGTPGAVDYWPCFSPDGRTVLFSRSMDGGRNWVLMQVPSSGGEAAPFFKQPLPVSATRADWSAKTGKIAFTATAADGTNSVWIANGDGTGAHKVAASGASTQLFYPSWYPDGKSLAVMDGGDNSIRKLDAGGGTAVSLTDTRAVLSGMASVSPDGAIAFAGQKNAGQAYNQNENVIWLMNGMGAPAPLESTPIQGRAPVWSADGKRVAFESDRASPDGRYAVFVINRDGTGLVQVTDYGLNANHPVWSPDGKKMVLTAIVPGTGSVIAITDFP